MALAAVPEAGDENGDMDQVQLAHAPCRRLIAQFSRARQGHQIRLVQA